MSIDHISPHFVAVTVSDRRLPGVLRTPGPPKIFTPCGRKKMKTDSENRTAWKTVRFTDAEAAEVDQHADACGLSASALIRFRTLNKPLPKGSAPEINRQVWRDLSPDRANLNQMTKHANEQRLADGRAVLDLVQVKALLHRLDNQIAQLRLELLGVKPN